MASELLAGLCSVTCRALGVDEIARAAAGCGLAAIEWGADVHVPPGDRAAIARARAASRGFEYVSYGSYLLAAGYDVDDFEIEGVLETAVALGAAHVRIWSPFGVERGSPATGAVVERIAAIATAAAGLDLTTGIEYHGGTLTATVTSAAALVDAAAAPNLSLYWQPPYWLPDRAPGDDAADVRALGTRIRHLHVYEWDPVPDVRRRPLADGEGRWAAVLAALADTPDDGRRSRAAFLEFVAGDDPANLAADARTLRRWIGLR
jgi:sugar phosphate isomerase/epimerase